MGAADSLADEFNVVSVFNKFVEEVKAKKKNLLTTSTKLLDQLSNQAESFFVQYQTLGERSNFIVQEVINLDSYFNNIILAIDGFRTCFEVITNKKVKRDDASTITVYFRNDFPKFVSQLIQFTNMATALLRVIIKEPLKGPLFYLELDIFDFALHSKKIDKPPYYSLTTLPVYSLHDDIQSIGSSKISITTPHGTGKTSLIPLLLACRLIKKSSSTRLVILIEHDIANISNIKNTYKQICFREEEDDFNEYDNEDNASLMITTSLSRVQELYEVLQRPKHSVFYPIVGILSPLDALRLIHSVKNIDHLISNSIFIIDDVHLRTIETDVFVQDIYRPLTSSKAKSNLPRFIMMSTIQDDSYNKLIGHHKELPETEEEGKVYAAIEKVECKSINEIARKMSNSIQKFLNGWLKDDDDTTCLGSVVVFVPSEKFGQKIYKEAFKDYNVDNATKVCRLNTRIRKGEDVHHFYRRLLDEMTAAEEERPPDSKTLFLVPILLSDNISPEERALIRSQLPLPFVDKLSRLFITTIKNEPLLMIQDLMVIFDSGIQEVEFFNPEQYTIHVRDQLLPKPFVSQHFKMISGCRDGKYYEFNIKDSERPENLVPSIKRCDLSRYILSLRNFGIKLENQNNLPSVPNYELRDLCFSLLQRIGIIDDSKDKELTPLGKEAAKYSSISPFFSLATTKFNEKPSFAYLCSLIIENSRYLITDPKSKLLCKHFERDSDLVTLLESICEISEGVEEGLEDTGISIGVLTAIYSQMENAFEGSVGRTLIIESVKWARSQPGGTIGMVDKFVSLLDQNEFLNKRKCEFVHVLGIGSGLEPTVVYKANDIFKFDEKDAMAKIKIARRPGWLGLQSPGNVYILSLIVEEESFLNRGLLIHRDRSEGSKNPGIISSNVENPALNTFFFVSLFEAFWSGHSTVDDFVGIYHSDQAKKESAFLIHMTEDDGKTFINYCPRNEETAKIMNETIPVLSQLIPFVPRSILAQVDIPLCAVEINGIGVSSQYVTRIHLITEPDSDLPFAYPINQATIKYANTYINELKKNISPIRFAITGESFYYKKIDGIERDAELVYPDVTPSLKSVFDTYHPSHMVLLVNKDYPNKPPVEALKWLPNEAEAAPKEAKDDTENNKMIISVASKIMNGIGYAERSNDVFYVSLGGGFPTVGKGSLPEVIYEKVNYDGKSIKLGIYPLIKHFMKEFVKKQILEKEIPLKELSSTDNWKQYPTNEDQRTNLCNQVNKALSNHFGLKEEDDVQSVFLGPSLLVIYIANLPENLVSHQINNNVWDYTYHPCKADEEIKTVLNGIKTVNFEITQIVHEPNINIRINHMLRMGMKQEEFENKIKEINDMFGFLRASQDLDYTFGSIEENKRGILGFVEVELIGLATGLAFVSKIKQEFQLDYSNYFQTMCTMRTCRGMAAIDPRLVPPDEKDGTKMVKLTDAEVEALKETIAMKNAGLKDEKWDLDTNFNILFVPETEAAAAKDMIRKVRDKDSDTTCIYICDPPQIFLPQTLYEYQKDGSVKSLAICKQCMIENFRSMDALQKIVDPLTHVIDRSKLNEINEQLPGIPFVDGTDDPIESWPQIPFGQGLWALMSDPEEIGPFLKSWFAAVIEIAIRKSAFHFTFCPNHPDIPYRTPKAGIKIKCPYCDMIYCDGCKIWHPMDQKCVTVDEGFKRCPNCNAPGVKVEGCNSIGCYSCGKYWCYKCEHSAIYENSSICHQHLIDAHGGYWT